MASLQELQSDLEELGRAHRSGVLRVTHGDKTIIYKSTTEIERAISIVEGQIAAMQGTPRKRQIRLHHRRGT